MAKKNTVPSIVKKIRDYDPPKPNFPWDIVVSNSQLVLYNSCPKKWSLQYRDKKTVFKENIYNVFGTAIHSSIQKFLDIMYSSTMREAEEFDIIGHFGEEFLKGYRKGYDKNKSVHFSTPEDLKEFYQDGENIIKEFLKRRAKYFSKRGWHLVGCEIPLRSRPVYDKPRVLFVGYIDVLMYHEPTGEFDLIDIKTSTKSWGDFQKKDLDKTNQVLLYKSILGELFGIPLNKINVHFLILKRKIWEESPFPTSRLQIFQPSQGSTSVKNAKMSLNKFINGAFDSKGYKDDEPTPTPTKWGCKFCPFALDDKLCGLGKQFIE